MGVGGGGGKGGVGVCAANFKSPGKGSTENIIYKFTSCFESPHLLLLTER